MRRPAAYASRLTNRPAAHVQRRVDSESLGDFRYAYQITFILPNPGSLPVNEPRPNTWEDWQLTAFVLGELDAETAARIQTAAGSDARLQRQLKGLKQTLDQVTLALQLESRAEAVELGQATATALIPPPVISRIAAPSPRRHRLQAVGLLGMAASLLIAVWYAGSHLFTQPHVAMNERSELPAALTEVAQASSTKSSEPRANEELMQELIDAAQSSLRARNNSEAKGSPRARLSKDPTLTAPPYSYSSSLLPGSNPVPGPDDVALGVGGYGGEGGYGGGAGYGGGGYGGAPPASGGGYGGMGMGMGGMRSGEGGAGYAGGGMGGYGGEGYSGGGYGGAMPASGGMGGGYGGGGYGGAPSGGAPRTHNQVAGGVGGGGYGGELTVLRTDPRMKYRTPRIIIQEEEEASYGSRERYESLVENQFQVVDKNPLSTFSIDVDSASYTKCRQLLLNNSRRPPPDAVRIEEFINYFDYEYAGPLDDKPFASHLAVATCPWQPQHKLVRIALQAKKVDLSERPAANVVFLLDVSGSMNEPNKLPLVKEAMRMLARQLGENDKVAMAVYAGAAGCVLEGTRGDQQQQILAAIDHLEAGGSTNGGQGIQLAYQLARDNFAPGGINRVVLCTDGDFNVGVTNTEALVDLVAENAKSNIFLTVLGFGAGKTNDAMMEQISNRGNGVYGFVDSRREAHRQMVQQLAGNLMTVAKDVKIQVEFNPTKVESYRLIGYENRMLATEDFNDDRKDAGEIGAGHRVTALYEIVPVGATSLRDGEPIDELRYQPKPSIAIEPKLDSNPAQVSDGVADELLAVKLRYKEPEGATSQLLTFPLADSKQTFGQADRDFQWAATVAQFGMLLRGSQYAGQSNWKNLLEQATDVAGVSPDATRQECLEMIRKCQR